jgi:hypothetical protein
MAKKYIDADRLKELLDAKYKEFTEKAKKDCPLQYQYMADGLDIAEQFIDSLQQEQEGVAERFARIVRGNLIGIDKKVQQKFEQLYFEVTGNKMYGGYND